MGEQQRQQVYEFGPFSLDTRERVLLRDGCHLPLKPKVYETLLALISQSGHVVDKEELMRAVWPDVAVEENNLTGNIYALRRAFAEYDCIETVPRRGYRFTADVKLVKIEDVKLTNGFGAETEVRIKESITTKRQPIDSLAVLPFINASADAEAEYLSDGITESIINNVAQLSPLRVMARNTVFRYKGKEANAQDVGQELKVGAVLLGRVLLIGDHLIVRAELVNVTDGAQLWGAQYKRTLSDILELQEEIANEISVALQLKLSVEEKERLTKRYTENLEAHHAYLKGRYFFYKRTEEGLRKGIEFFQQAIEIDPTHALAYSGLADCYAILSWLGESPPKESYPKAKAAALKALEIDDSIAEAYTSLAMVRTYYDLGWTAGETDFKRAIELQPSYALAHHWYGLQLLALGRFDESIAETRRAQELDPLSPLMNTGLGSSFHFARQHDRAIEQYRQTLAIDPNFALAHHGLGWAYEQKRMYREAILEFQKASTLSAGNTLIVASLSHAYAVAGKRGEALKLLAELQEQSKRKYISPYGIAIGYTGLGE